MSPGAAATEPISPGASKLQLLSCVQQLLKPTDAPRAYIPQQRSRNNEKPARCNKEQPLLATARESPRVAKKIQCKQKSKLSKYKKKLKLEVPIVRFLTTLFSYFILFYFTFKVHFEDHA